MEAHDITIFEQDGSVDVSLHLKFPADLDLRSAAEIARRIEQGDLRRPEVAAVQTHLEPLERTLSAREADAAAEIHAIADDRAARTRANRLKAGEDQAARDGRRPGGVRHPARG